MKKLIPSLIIISLFYNACSQPVKTVANAKYDLAKPEVLKMPGELIEISGIAFNKGNPDTLYAEQDEEGKLFYFSPKNMEVKHQKFGKKGDYEDITICNGTVIMLRSDGNLFSFPFNVHAAEEIDNVQETENVLPEGEYEGMYGDEAGSQLYVLCKKCSTDDDSKSVTGYILQLAAGKSITLKGNFQVNVKEIAAKLDQKKVAFKPAALAKNLKDNEWYILSSVNKLLVTTDDHWNIKEVYPLDPALFNQPEGIAFDRDNNMYISNEGGDTGRGTVLKFTPKK